MIDPRFANAGAAPYVSAFGAQQMPMNYTHHRHHKHKSRKDQSPLSRDESIHKVDHGQTHAYQQNENVPYASGYGVPYTAGGGLYPQYFGGAPLTYTSQYQGVPFAQNPFGAVHPGQRVKPHRRHHHHHHHHGVETETATTAVSQAQPVPEQLIGQRSSSVLSGDAVQVRSPLPSSDGAAKTETHHRHRHHHHHRGEHTAVRQSSRAHEHLSAVGTDGYGHINGDLIFIERGQHSPHRQEPPPGYEYKGKIEVQGANAERRSRSRGHVPTFAPRPPMPPPQQMGPCPPGWQQVILSAAPGGPCPPGGGMFTGQVVGAGGVNYGGYGGTTAGFNMNGGGASSSGGGLANLAASYPFPAHGQLIEDYIVESNAGGGNSSGEHAFPATHQPTGGSSSYVEHFHSSETTENISGRPTVIEVWQKRPKSETGGKSRSRSRSHSPKVVGPSFDFERFRHEILIAIERIGHSGGSTNVRPHGNGHDGGTQTQIHPNPGGSDIRKGPEIRQETSAGEVRVIVQPLQPVFYMPRQTASTTTPQIGPGPSAANQPQTSSGAPHIVYVPRNVYVPVIKPVFVPRERVIVRPQVIHVARPVLVDRPVPVTQRPIIIDRERPIPVPVRSGDQGAAQTAGSNVTREEYVYRDNLPVAYGGRCAEFTGGGNYGYVASEQDAQYATSSTNEVSSNYQPQGVNVPNTYHSSSHLDVQPDAGSFHGSYTNLARANSGSAVNVGQLNQQVIQQTLDQSARIVGAPANCPTQIEILDTAVNPFWQKTDQSTLMRRYGRPAYEIVHRTDQVEQQMYNELRQQHHSSEIQRSASSASYGSGSGVGMNASGAFDAAGIHHY